MSEIRPVVLIVEGFHDRFEELFNCLNDFDGGYLVREFEVIHLDCYAALKYWYSVNPGRFVSVVLQGVDFTGLVNTDKLVGYPELRYPAPKGFDARKFQGLVIYALMRENNIDPIVPVLLVSREPRTEESELCHSFMVYPAQGVCHIMHVPDEASGLAAVAERVNAIALRPLDDARRCHWREVHKMVVGRSRKMTFLVHEIERLGPGDSIVLLLGKPGVGKELVANSLHRCSPRFVADDELREFPAAVNIAAIDRNLIEVELFGHARGAYTGSVGERPGVFEFGCGSTVFLDEIGEIGPQIQLKLLRTMENHRVKRIGSPSETPVDMRLIAATNRTIDELAESFRPDFYSRVVQQCLPIPSLAERWQDEAESVLEADLHELFGYCVEARNAGPRQPRRLGVDDGAVRFLRQLVIEFIQGDNDVFQGNMRTLRAMLDQAWERAQHDGSQVVTVGHILSTISVLRFMERGREPVTTRARSLESVAGCLKMQVIEKLAITEALVHSRGSATEAAEILGLHRTTLRRKMTEYGF